MSEVAIFVFTSFRTRPAVLFRARGPLHIQMSLLRWLFLQNHTEETHRFLHRIQSPQNHVNNRAVFFTAVKSVKNTTTATLTFIVAY